MTSETDKCGISSILPLSCRERAEAFAKHLNSRLQKLGSHEGVLINNDAGWLMEDGDAIATSQPKATQIDKNGDNYYDYRLTESPGSPVDDEKNELTNLLNDDDTLKKYNDDVGRGVACNSSCHNSGNSVTAKRGDGLKISNSLDSDSSDGPYYQAEADDKVLLLVNNSEATDEADACCCPQTSQFLDISSLEKTDDDSANLSSFDSCTQSEPLTDSQDDDNNDRENDKDDDTNADDVNRDDVDDASDVSVQLPELKVDVDAANEGRAADDEEEDEDAVARIPRVRRCSSLKSGKTPPGTPGRKKIVRFADVLGLDLADVRTFLDEVPKIPTSAYSDLAVTKSLSDASLYGGNGAAQQNLTKILIPMFQQPGGQTNFLDVVKEKNVCLENVMVEDPVSFAIRGTVRVRNLDFHKSVHVRYTLDTWNSYSDLQATYVQNSCDGFSDKFTFLLYAHTLNVGDRLEFAIRFQTKGCQYWDNNCGVNYCFECLPNTAGSSNLAIASSSYPDGIPMDDKIGAAFYYVNDTDHLTRFANGLTTTSTSNANDNGASDTVDVVDHDKKLLMRNIEECMLKTMAFHEKNQRTSLTRNYYHKNFNNNKYDVIFKQKDISAMIIIIIFSILFLYIFKKQYIFQSS